MNYKEFHVNLNNLPSSCYNLSERDKYFKLLTLNKKSDLELLSKGDEIMKEAADKIVSLSSDPGFISELEKQQILEYAKAVALEKAEDRGKEIGINQRNIEIAKKMLDDNVDISFISKYSGLSIDEIEGLKQFKNFLYKIYFLYFFLTFFLLFFFYNIFGDTMKKYFWSIILSLVVGIYLGKFTLSQYDDFNVFPVSFGSDTIYFLQEGVYSNVDVMKNSMSSFDYYIYDKEDDGYHTYVGITKSRENALKLEGFYEEKGYDIYVRENSINNNSFASVLTQYDILLSNADKDSIDSICSQILSSYEELVINEDKGNTEE